jgi:hypothetical protein
LYPELKEFKDKIELLDESPTTSSTISEKKDLSVKNLFTKKFLLIQ